MGLTNRLRNAFAAGLDGLRRTEYEGDTPIFGASPIAGVAVDKDSALQLAAFWGCVRYVSSSIALLPWGAFRATDGGGREALRKHKVWALLHDSPAPGMTAFSMREALVWNALVSGNGLAEIMPQGLSLMDMTRVRFRKLDNGSLAYDYFDQGGMRTLLAPDVLHIKGPSRDGVMGLSVISAARECIGLGLAEQAYGSAFYGVGTHVGGIYEHPGTPNPVQLDALRESIDKDKGARSAHRPRILTGGMKYVSDTIPPQDAQFLETRKYSAREIAALFGVPPHKIGIEEGATAYASREQAAIEAVIDCLLPWTIRLEQEADLKLLAPRERAIGIYTHMNLDVHMRGDAKSRSEFYGGMLRAGGMTPNEMRALEELPSAANGDDLLIPRDLIPLSLASEYAQSQISANTTKQLAAQAFAPLVADTIDCIKTRAAQDKERGRSIESTREFARLKLEPLKQAHAVAGLPFDIEETERSCYEIVL
jgi:HK97 family phage portal protein